MSTPSKNLEDAFDEVSETSNTLRELQMNDPTTTTTSTVGATARSTRTLPYTANVIINKVSIEPVREPTFKTFKRLEADLAVAAGNNEKPNLKALLAPVKRLIELQFRAANEWDLTNDGPFEELPQTLLFEVIPGIPGRGGGRGTHPH
jgi:hypothetical protein